MKRENNIRLSKEEKELLSLFKTEKLNRSKTAKEDIKKAKIAASTHMRKNARINIRISEFDLERIRRVAAEEGVPYQTFIASILHKYVNGRLNLAHDLN